MKRKIFVADGNHHHNIEIDAPLGWLMVISDLENEIHKYQMEFSCNLSDEDMELFRELEELQQKLWSFHEELDRFIVEKFVYGLKGKHYTGEQR